MKLNRFQSNGSADFMTVIRSASRCLGSMLQSRKIRNYDSHLKTNHILAAEINLPKRRGFQKPHHKINEIEGGNHVKELNVSSTPRSPHAKTWKLRRGFQKPHQSFSLKFWPKLWLTIPAKFFWQLATGFLKTPSRPAKKFCRTNHT